MTDLQDFPGIVADLVLEAPEHADRLERARALMSYATGLVVGLEGERRAAEIAYRVADRLVEGFN